MDSWQHLWQLRGFTLQPKTTFWRLKIRWNIEICDRKSPTTLVWRYGFWKSVRTGLWSWQPGCHHVNYEHDWSSLTHISIFWLYSGVFLCFFWARYDFQRLCWSSRSSNETKWMPFTASEHPILGWVGQVWVLSVMNFMNRARERRQSKIAKNRP